MKQFIHKAIRHPLKKTFIQTSLCLLLVSGGLAGCAQKEFNHGHVLRSTDLQQVQVGMGKDQVKLLLGTPDTSATYAGEVYYYISSKMTQTLFLKPKLRERNIVAVYFDQNDAVQRLANYGLKDGKVFDYISRETPAAGAEASLLKELFGSLGTKKNMFSDGDIP